MEKLELVGGRSCLDFANTVEPRRGGTGHDHLGSYADLVRWAVRVGELTEEDAGRLLGGMARRPDSAEVALRRARSLRETIYRVFSAVLRGEEPRRSDLETLSRANAAAVRHSRVVREAAGFGWSWTDGENPDRPVWPLVRSAVELLTAGELERLKECPVEDGGCGWLFFDESKNRSRRWCSMSDCGSKAKMRKFYARKKRGRTAPDG